MQDAHGDSEGRMVKDKSQDYQLVVGYQYQGGTVLRFKRKINTCDGDDLIITVRIDTEYTKSSENLLNIL